jgi:hypothetical protein
MWNDRKKGIRINNESKENKVTYEASNKIKQKKGKKQESIK